MAGTDLLPPKEASLVKQVQELAINGDEPPTRYIRKDRDEAPFDFEASLSSSIPVIDLHVMSSPLSSLKEKEEELEKLRSALSTWGLFQVVGHDIPNSLLDEVRKIGKDFFDLPMEEKKRYYVENDGKQEFSEGYGNDLIVSEDQLLDWSDRLYLLLRPHDQRNFKLWPNNPDSFRNVLIEFNMKVELVVELILKGFAKILGLHENYILNQVGERGPIFGRFNYYPPCPKPDLVYGITPHTDGGAITVVLQEKEVEGLQVLKDGHWTKVPSIPHALLVNVADQVEIMSNGVFKSPMHRVMTNAERSRISLAMFYVPEYEKVIEPAAGLITESMPRLFKTIKMKDYSTVYFQQTLEGKRAIDWARI